MKNELVTGDLVLALVAGEVLAFEFYGWWDGHRQISTLVVPHNGVTFLAHPDQILCLVTGGKVIRLNPASLRFRQSRNNVSKTSPQEAAGEVIWLPHAQAIRTTS